MSYVKLWVKGQSVLCKAMGKRTVCHKQSYDSVESVNVKLCSENSVSYDKLSFRECNVCFSSQLL